MVNKPRGCKQTQERYLLRTGIVLSRIPPPSYLLFGGLYPVADLRMLQQIKDSVQNRRDECVAAEFARGLGVRACDHVHLVSRFRWVEWGGGVVLSMALYAGCDGTPSPRSPRIPPSSF